eukprot:UN21897
MYTLFHPIKTITVPATTGWCHRRQPHLQIYYLIIVFASVFNVIK